MESTPHYIRGPEIARGGMGAVLEARDRRLGRTVAMKVILANGADPAEKERFLQEAKVLAELPHPNIVPIHDLGIDELGQNYYTMKLVQGTTLNEILIRIAKRDPDTLRQYPLNTLLTVFQKVCDAIGFAHSRGIIHRDLKPQNIMVGAFGEVLVMDWGLAKIVNSEFTQFLRHADLVSSDTQTVVLSPEQGGRPQDPPPPPGAALSGDLPTMVDAPFASADLPTMAEVPQPGAADLATIADTPASQGTTTDAGAALSQSQLTLEGAVMGTPNFMSPEQAQGRISELDARSDIFSLGGVLYAILTLRPPVSGSSLDEILSKVRNGTIVEPTQLNSIPSFFNKARSVLKREIQDAAKIEDLPHCPRGRVPARLSAVVMKALSRSVSDRYQTVPEFSKDITAFQNGFATVAEEAGLLTLLRLFIQRHRTATAAVAIGAIMAVAFMAKVMASERRATHEAKRATSAEIVAVDALASAETERENQRRAFARAQTALGESAIREIDGLRARELLELVPDDLRDADWRYLNERADTSSGTLPNPPGARALGIEPFPGIPGVFAIARSDGTIALSDHRNSKQLLEFPTIFGSEIKSPFTMSVSQLNGEMAVANWDDDRIAFHNALSGQKLREWKAGRPWMIEFSPTRNQLLFSPEPVAGQAVQLRLYDVESGAVVWTYDPGVDWILATFHPDGDQIIAALGQDAAVALDAKTGEELREFPATGPLVYRVAASPDGELAAFGDGQGGVTVVSVAEARPVTRFRAGENIIRMLAFTPDSSRLVTLTYPPNQSFHHAQIWDAYSGHALQSVLGVSRNSRNGAIHPRSGELVIAGDDVKTWPLARLEPTWIVDSGINPPLVRFWPNDDSILLNDASGRPRLMSLLEDGSTATNWHSPIVCGRDAVLSTSGRAALIGGASFDLSATFYFYLQHRGNQIDQPLLWQSPELLPWLSLNPTGDRVWTFDRVLNPATGKELSAPTTNAPSLDFGEWLDGVRLVGATQFETNSAISILDSKSGVARLSMTNDSPIFVLAVSSDRALVIEGGQDRLIRVRSAETLETLREFRVHDAAVSALAIHPVRPIIATASEDLTIRLWNHETGQLLEELRGPPSPAMSLHFSPGGSRLASAGANGLALVWEPLSLRLPATEAQ